MFVLVQNCVRVKCFECKTATASARARTRAANAYTKRDIENLFPGTQMFVQARNNEYKYNKTTKNVLNNC